MEQYDVTFTEHMAADAVDAVLTPPPPPAEVPAVSPRPLLARDVESHERSVRCCLALVCVLSRIVT